MVKVGCINCGHTFFDASNGSHVFTASAKYDSEVEFFDLSNGGGYVYLFGETSYEPACGSFGMQIVKNGSKALKPWYSESYCNDEGDGQITVDASVSVMRVYPDGTASSFSGDFHATALVDAFWGFSEWYVLLLNGTSGKKIWSFHTSTRYSYKIQPYRLLAGMTLPRGVVGAFQVNLYDADNYQVLKSALLHALYSDGSVKLVRNLTTYDWFDDNVFSGDLTLPILVRDGSRGNYIAAINPFSLEVLWNVSMRVQTPMQTLFVDERLFGVSTYDYTIQVIDLATGKNVSRPVPFNYFGYEWGVQGQLITVKLASTNGFSKSNWIAAYDPLNTLQPKMNLTIPLSMAGNRWSVNVATGDFYSVNTTVLFANNLSSS